MNFKPLRRVPCILLGVAISYYIFPTTKEFDLELNDGRRVICERSFLAENLISVETKNGQKIKLITCWLSPNIKDNNYNQVELSRIQISAPNFTKTYNIHFIDDGDLRGVATKRAFERGKEMYLNIADELRSRYNEQQYNNLESIK